SGRELPVVEQPAGAPDTFEDYAKLMFDLQVLAYQSDLTRVITFMIAPELSARTYPEAGVPEAHHALSHHQGRADNLTKLAKINAYTAQRCASSPDPLQPTVDAEGCLLDNVAVLYSRGMADSNAPTPIGLPLVLFEKDLGGGRHLRFDAAPLTNLYTTMLDKL